MQLPRNGELTVMVNILIVEDNEDLRKLMKIHMARAGYSVFEAGNGADALEQLEKAHIHLMIVDIMMPVMDGFELTTELRSAGIRMPLIILSAKDSIDDKREGFVRGADDYMTKPVDFDELLLHVEALLRRCGISRAGALELGGCRIDPETLTVSSADNTVELRLKEFNLLHMLLSYPGRIFTRQKLMDDIWGLDSESDPRTVDTHIKRVREKLECFPGFEIQTVRGLGYKAVIKK